MTDARSRLIVALDLPGRRAALDMVSHLTGRVGWFKVGLELFVREGPALVEAIRNRGENVFLDLKLHDIPNTVAAAVRSAGSLGAQMLTVHASGGRAALSAAAEAAASLPSPPLLLAVTALTSLSAEEANRVGIQIPLAEWVERLAVLAIGCGIRGLVASALELPRLGRVFGGSVRIVVPGIRPAGSAAHDQYRTATPADAIRSGASFLVVGRPILHASDPAAAADEIVSEIVAALPDP